MFFPYTIYITYGAPACTTCLFILNLSKNSHLCFAIVSESGCKGKRFYRNHQMFSKVFFEKVFFRNFHKRRDVHPPQVLSVLAPLAPLRKDTGCRHCQGKLSYVCFTKSVTHCLKCRVSLDCGCKGRPFNDYQQTYEGKIIRIS